MDGADKASIKLAQLKAETSARFPLASPTSSEHSHAHPAKPYASLPGLTLLEGGLPIMDKNGLHIGGIGISGATPELDAQFTRVALEELGGERSAIHEPHLSHDGAAGYRGISGEQFHGRRAS